MKLIFGKICIQTNLPTLHWIFPEDHICVTFMKLLEYGEKLNKEIENRGYHCATNFKDILKLPMIK